MKRTYGIWVQQKKIGEETIKLSHNSLICERSILGDMESLYINYNSIDYTPQKIRWYRNFQDTIIERNVSFTIPQIEVSGDSFTQICWFNGYIFHNAQILYMLPLILDKAERLYGNINYLNVFDPISVEIQPVTYLKVFTETKLIFQILSPMKTNLIFDQESLVLQLVELQHIKYVLESDYISKQCFSR